MVKAKRRVGRPFRLQNDSSSVNMVVRLSTTEMQRMKDFAGLVGATVSDVVRNEVAYILQCKTNFDKISK